MLPEYRMCCRGTKDPTMVGLLPTSSSKARIPRSGSLELWHSSSKSTMTGIPSVRETLILSLEGSWNGYYGWSNKERDLLFFASFAQHWSPTFYGLLWFGTAVSSNSSALSAWTLSRHSKPWLHTRQYMKLWASLISYKSRQYSGSRKPSFEKCLRSTLMTRTRKSIILVSCSVLETEFMSLYFIQHQMSYTVDAKLRSSFLVAL